MSNATAYTQNGTVKLGPWDRPLEWWYNEIMLAGVQYDVDPRLIVAIAQIETHFGADNCAGVAGTNNPFCIGDLNPVRYNSIPDAITAVARILVAQRNAGKNTLEQLYSGEKGAYCTSPGCAAKAKTIGDIMEKMGGDRAKLKSDCFMSDSGRYYQVGGNYLRE